VSIEGLFHFGSVAVMVCNTDFFINCTREMLAHEVMQMSVYVIKSSSGYSLADMRQVKSSNV